MVTGADMDRLELISLEKSLARLVDGYDTPGPTFYGVVTRRAPRR